MAQRFEDYMAVEAVCCELVSVTVPPNNRESYRLWNFEAIFVSLPHANSDAYGKILSAMEQGVFFTVLGSDRNGRLKKRTLEVSSCGANLVDRKPFHAKFGHRLLDVGLFGFCFRKLVITEHIVEFQPRHAVYIEPIGSGPKSKRRF
jgi:hypothetical protein